MKRGFLVVITALPLAIFEQTPLFRDLVQLTAVGAALVFALLAAGVLAYNLTR